MERLERIVTFVERAVVSPAAVPALLPLCRWWSGREDRMRDRLADITRMLATCKDVGSIGSLGAVDVCSTVTTGTNRWEDGVYASDRRMR